MERIIMADKFNFVYMKRKDLPPLYMGKYVEHKICWLPGMKDEAGTLEIWFNGKGELAYLPEKIAIITEYKLPEGIDPE